MRPSQITGIATAAFLSVTISAFAQTPTTQTPPPQTPTTQSASTAGEDCGAADLYGMFDERARLSARPQPRRGHGRRRRPRQRVRARGCHGLTGKGAGCDDAVVRRIRCQRGSGDRLDRKCADQGTAYRLTGPNEAQLKTLVGRQVEIQGRFKDPTDPRTGEKLPNEVELLSFRAAPAPAAVSAPAAPPTPAQTTPPPSPPPAQTAPPPPPLRPRRHRRRSRRRHRNLRSKPRRHRHRHHHRRRPRQPTATRTELPRTASSTALLALVGVLALSSGFVLTHRRRRDQ